jgi:hypothetical protein
MPDSNFINQTRALEAVVNPIIEASSGRIFTEFSWPNSIGNDWANWGFHVLFRENKYHAPFVFLEGRSPDFLDKMTIGQHVLFDFADKTGYWVNTEYSGEDLAQAVDLCGNRLKEYIDVLDRVEEITSQIDQVVERYLDKDEQDRFIEEFGHLRRSKENWPQFNGASRYGQIYWSTFTEDSIGSSDRRDFNFVFKPTTRGEQVGFYIGNLYVGNNLETAIRGYDLAIKTMLAKPD